METERKFYIGEFMDGSTTVLPSTWVFRDLNGFSCHWNSSMSKVVNYELPNSRWPVHAIKRVVAQRGKKCQAWVDLFINLLLL